MTHPTPLAAERDALRIILDRLMNEDVSLETLCKLAPRVVSVAANVARIQDALESNPQSGRLDQLLEALEELAEEENEPQEKYAW